MDILMRTGSRSFVAGLAGMALALSALLAGCGGGGGGGDPAPTQPNPATGSTASALPLMVDGFGREVPEVDFGRGDPLAAGAEGIAYDSGAIANAQVTLVDSVGATRTATTDSSGYYRIDIKNLQLPFLVKVKRADGTEWFSAGVNSAITRGFVPININGLTDKVIGYVAEARGLAGGAASTVTPGLLSPPATGLAPAKARVRAGLAGLLINAGLDAASYDPITLPLQSPTVDRHASFLQSLKVTRNAQGRSTVVALVAGGARALLETANEGLSRPGAIAVDGAGNLYVVEMDRNVIWKITPDGKSSAFAGSSKRGFSDGAGSAAAFKSPSGLAADRAGNVYVADVDNNAIRKIDAAGVVSTLAGGVRGFADGTGTSARFDTPKAVAVDAAGNVFVADHFNEAVRKISPSGSVTTVASKRAGERCCGDRPDGVAVDAAGTIYVANRSGVLKISPDGTLSDFFFPSKETSPWFTPRSIAADAGGTVYLTDVFTNRIHRITPDGLVSDLAAGGAQGSAIAVDTDGNLFVTDPSGDRVRKVTPAGAVSTVAGQRRGLQDGAGVSAVFDRPEGVAVDAEGNIIVADTGNDAIRRISRTGVVTTLAGGAPGGFADGNGLAAKFNAPTDVAIDKSGNVYVADRNNNVIRKVTAAGMVTTFAGSGVAGFSDGPGMAATFSFPSYLAVDGDGNVYVSDVGNESIRKITAAGVVSTLAGLGLVTSPGELAARGVRQVRDIAVDSQGRVYFEALCGVIRSSQCVVTIAPGGATGSLSGSSASGGTGLAVDSAGNRYSFDFNARSLYVITPAGVRTEFAGHDAGWQSPNIAVQVDGSLVVSDKENSTIHIVLP